MGGLLPSFKLRALPLRNPTLGGVFQTQHLGNIPLKKELSAKALQSVKAPPQIINGGGVEGSFFEGYFNGLSHPLREKRTHPSSL